MKYLVILIAVILLVRIDVLLNLFDRASEKLDSSSAPAEVNVDEVASRETIPVNQDRALQKTKKDTFFALLEDFHTSPVAEIRQRAMSILKDNPTMFGQKLDKDLESHVFRWRDLLNNNDPQVVLFMIELMTILQGENLEMIRKFFALWMDINMENFIAAYSRTRDSNCTIATTFGDNIPEEEKLNEYYDRQETLAAFLAREKVDPVQRALATSCLTQLNLQIEKLAPKAEPGSQTADESSATSTTLTPDPAAAPGMTP
jgi:hypothetical protein